MHWEQNSFLPPKSTFLRSWQPLILGWAIINSFDGLGTKSPIFPFIRVLPNIESCQVKTNYKFMELLSKQTGQNITCLLFYLFGCIDFDTFGIHSVLFRGSYFSSSQCGNQSVTHSNLDNVPIVTKRTCMDCINIDIFLYCLSKVTFLCSKVFKSRTCQFDGSIILLPNGHWFLNHGCFTN